jgi:hypothetical protein
MCYSNTMDVTTPSPPNTNNAPLVLLKYFSMFFIILQ